MSATRVRVIEAFIRALRDQAVPSECPLYVTQAMLHYYQADLQIAGPSEGKMWLLGHELILDDYDARHMTTYNIVAHSAEKFYQRGRFAELKPGGHPWDLHWCNLFGSVWWKRFDAEAAMAWACLQNFHGKASDLFKQLGLDKQGRFALLTLERRRG